MSEEKVKPAKSKKKVLINTLVLAVASAVLGYFFPEKVDMIMPIISKVVITILSFV
ncbi:MAG: hypothetical protein KAG37_04005 [Flavobacteriales bacterium]|nr:hypothetical protein [Flavobacteriales bacterium]